MGYYFKNDQAMAMTFKRMWQPFILELISRSKRSMPPNFINASYYFRSKSCINAVTSHKAMTSISSSSPRTNCACFRGTTDLILNDNSSKSHFQVKYRSFSIGSNFKACEKNNWTWRETRFNGLTLDLGVILQNPDKKQFLQELEGMYILLLENYFPLKQGVFMNMLHRVKTMERTIESAMYLCLGAFCVYAMPKIKR